jgi:hypothetical protein
VATSTRQCAPPRCPGLARPPQPPLAAAAAHGPPAIAPPLPRAPHTLKRPHGLARKCQCFS